MKRLPVLVMSRLILLANDMRRTVDATLGDLVERGATGDETVWPAVIDRLKDLGREEQAEKIRKLVGV